MESKGFHRKLTAILSADVTGYSRLMQDDEAATVSTLEAYKQIFSDLILQHRGRVVDSPGDNLLAEFASVVDAVQCAVAVHKELEARNSELPENRRMQFRIGVNLGDVIEEESRIYGDGVNIAARLESIADPGGICISKTAFDQIETKLPFGYTYLGEQKVKNIVKPVGAYKVLMERRVTKERGVGFKSKGTGRRIAVIGLAALLMIIAGAVLWQLAFHPTQVAPPAPKTIEKADPQKMAFPLPDKPSIAVLPFTSMGDDPKTELLSGGITENVIGALSKVPGLMVIARSSTAGYKGKAVTTKQVSEELGVQYVLEGSVQRSEDRIRISVGLVDALSGSTVWTERYDRPLADVFALQDEITMRILNALRVKFGGVPGVAEKYFRGGQSLDCFLMLLEAHRHLQAFTADDLPKALQLAQAAIAQCPDIPGGYVALGWVYNQAIFLGTMPRTEALERAFEMAHKALAIDESLSDAYDLLGFLYLHKGEGDKALAASERAVSLNPGNPIHLADYGVALNYEGRWADAITVFEKAIRLNPYSIAYIFRGYAVSLLGCGRVNEAIDALKKAVQRSPNDNFSHILLVRAYSMAGKDHEAAAKAAEVLRINPKFNLEAFAQALPPTFPDRSALLEALRKAGLPEKSTYGQSQKDSSGN